MRTCPKEPAKNYEIGKVKKGLDGKFWSVSETKTGKKWTKGRKSKKMNMPMFNMETNFPQPPVINVPSISYNTPNYPAPQTPFFGNKPKIQVKEQKTNRSQFVPGYYSFRNTDSVGGDIQTSWFGKQCGNNAKSIQDLADICNKREDCIGFTMRDGKPWCLKKGKLNMVHDKSHDLFVKAKDFEFFSRKSSSKKKEKLRYTYTKHKGYDSFGGDIGECGSWGENLEDIKRECDKRDNCLGFTMRDGKPWCLKKGVKKSNSYLLKLNKASDHEVYVKKDPNIIVEFDEYKKVPEGEGIMFELLKGNIKTVSEFIDDNYDVNQEISLPRWFKIPLKIDNDLLEDYDFSGRKYKFDTDFELSEEVLKNIYCDMFKGVTKNIWNLKKDLPGSIGGVADMDESYSLFNNGIEKWTGKKYKCENTFTGTLKNCIVDMTDWGWTKALWDSGYTSESHLNVWWEEYNTPLLLAMKLDNIKIAKKLIEAGADLEIQNKAGCTPLMVAIGANFSSPFTMKYIKLLVELGANVNFTSKGSFFYGWRPLTTAVSRNRPDVVKYLLENGADFNYEESYYSDNRIISKDLHLDFYNDQIDTNPVLRACHTEREIDYIYNDQGDWDGHSKKETMVDSEKMINIFLKYGLDPESQAPGYEYSYLEVLEKRLNFLISLDKSYLKKSIEKLQKCIDIMIEHS